MTEHGDGKRRIDSLGRGNDLPQRQLYTLLAEANLLRMRGSLDLAVERCLSAMVTWPGDAQVYSLLGDIYRDKGDNVESARWYGLASSHNPDSQVDRFKHDQALNTQDNSATRTRWPVATPPAVLLKRITIVLSVLTIFAIAAGSVALIHGRHKDESSVPTVVAPAVLIDSSSPTDLTRKSVLSIPVEQTESDVRLALQSTAAQRLPVGTTFDVLQDPRSGAITIAVELPDMKPTRTFVMDTAKTVGSALNSVSATDSIKSATVRVELVPPAPQSEQASTLLFAADYTPGIADPLLTGFAPPLRIVGEGGIGAFSQIWWSPSLHPDDNSPARTDY